MSTEVDFRDDQPITRSPELFLEPHVVAEVLREVENGSLSHSGGDQGHDFIMTPDDSTESIASVISFGKYNPMEQCFDSSTILGVTQVNSSPLRPTYQILVPVEFHSQENHRRITPGNDIILLQEDCSGSMASNPQCVYVNPMEQHSCSLTNFGNTKPKRRTNVKIAKHSSGSPANKGGKFICQYCSSEFPYKSKYDQHLRVHTKEQPFKCELCPAKFTQSGKLTIHMRVHNNDKPFKCATCEKAFKTKYQLDEHEKALHDEDRVRIKCEHCQRTYSKRSHLNTHLKKYGN